MHTHTHTQKKTMIKNLFYVCYCILETNVSFTVMLLVKLILMLTLKACGGTQLLDHVDKLIAAHGDIIKPQSCAWIRRHLGSQIKGIWVCRRHREILFVDRDHTSFGTAIVCVSFHYFGRKKPARNATSLVFASGFRKL